MPRTSSPPPAKRARTNDSSGHSRPSGSGAGANGHMSEASSSSSGLPPLSLSILGVEPLDEFIKEIADFVHYQVANRPDIGGNIEVEAKIGVLRDKMTGQRVDLPVLVESIIQPGSVDSRFESNMSVNQHKHFNNLLNNLKTSSHSTTSSPLNYSHLYLVDSFYPGEKSGEKIRVTRDEKSGQVIECMQKIRLGNLDIYSPKRAADWRVSVNLEVPVSHPIGSAQHQRRKDRMSYSHEEFVIDLTQVTSTMSPNAQPQILHELELEFARPEILLSTAATRGDVNVSEHERSAFDELIRAFVNNARILVRNSLLTERWQ